MSDELKQELDAHLSELIRQYEDRGLSPNEIGDSLRWHGELAESREQSEPAVLSAD